ncbi:MAG TPA: NAD-dependent malic enzyme, partial [Actinomycetota bacterium]|nr:NAD-dependent malic enzyme [Actinomycetota bacterium]
MTERPYEFVTTTEGPVLRVRARGFSVLGTPMLNRGTAFTPDERRALGLVGLLPHGVSTIDGQLRRVHAQYQRQPDDLARNVYLANLRDRNEVLFYRLLSEHLGDMLPIVYTPTVGKAIERYSHEYRRPRGVFLSVDHPDLIEESFRNYGLGADDVDLIVATDAEGILGIGDWGVGGIEIAIGKLAVYIAAAGIHPRRVIPVVLDMGTDNLRLLNDKMYLGNRHARVRGQRYDDFIDTYVTTAIKLFPHALLHWEDLGAANARRVLQRYADQCCTFNDDMQGTAAVVLAAALAAARASETRIGDQRVVIHGAGTAGLGIADMLREVMVREGLSPEEATRRFWCLDRQGLITDDRLAALHDFQRPYARPAAEVAGWARTGTGQGPSLADVVGHVHPTMLIGTSTQAGAFSEQIVREMAAHCTRPIIMPLSNPTSKAEALPADVLA